MSGFDTTAPSPTRLIAEEQKDDTAGLGYIDVYDIFIIAQDKKYLITCDQNMTRIFRCKELRPISASGRQSVTDIDYPVVFRQFMPIFDSDPCGMAPYELISHDQLNKSTMINLARERVYKNLSNAMLVKAGSVDASELTHDSNEITEIHLDDNERLGDVASFSPTAAVPLNEMMTLIDLFERQIADNTGVNDIAKGNPQAEVETLGEVEIRSQNLNTRNRKRLEESIETRKEQVRLWFTQYLRHFKEADSRKKTIMIQTGEIPVPYNLTPKDFNADIPNIVVKSIALDKAENQNRAKTLYSLLNTFQAMGDQDAVTNATREILMLEGGVEEHKLDKYAPESPLLQEIYLENEVLAENVPLELPLEADVLTRLRYQKNIPTDAGRKRYQDLIIRASEQRLEQQQAMQQQMLQQEMQGGGQMAPGTKNVLGEEMDTAREFQAETT